MIATIHCHCPSVGWEGVAIGTSQKTCLCIIYFVTCGGRGRIEADSERANSHQKLPTFDSPSRKTEARSLRLCIMKISGIWWVVFAVTTLLTTACESPSEITPKGEVITIDFEEAELGSLTLDGYNPTTYEKVLAGKTRATLCEDSSNQLHGCLLFDDILYSENGANFGSFFSDFKELWGGVFDTVYAFVISSNNNLEVATVHNQYSVYSTTNGSNKFAVAYDGTWWSPTHQNRYGEYDLPTIIFDSPVKPISVKVANSTYTYLQIMANDPNVRFAIKALGYLDGEQTSKATITLADQGSVISDWTTLSLSALGKVDKVSFTVDWEHTSSKVKAPEEWCPFSFCIDDLKVRK